MKIEAEQVKRPFKLSELAEHFGESRHNLLVQLSTLATQRKVFAHDIEQVDEEGDYELSAFATTLLLTEFGVNYDRLMKLATFLGERTPREDQKNFLVNIYVTMRSLQMKMDGLKIKRGTSRNKRKLKSRDAMLDKMMEQPACGNAIEN